jgi:excinuclease ABC subunit A
VLDEPTTGLHFEDIRKLLMLLNGLVDKGNTVIVIEHNLDVIKTADWLIDMGPDGGHKGGLVLAAGTPEEVAEVPESYTGQFLRPVLKLTGEAAGSKPATARAAKANGAPTGSGAATGKTPAGTTNGTTANGKTTVAAAKPRAPRSRAKATA